VICAETAERAEQLALSTDLVWVRYQRGEFGLLPSPEEAAAYNWNEFEQMVARAGRSRHFIGTPDLVLAQIDELVRTTSATEVIVTTMIHDHRERVRSYELLAGAAMPVVRRSGGPVVRDHLIPPTGCRELNN
jgi:alkanesulfonate monooxygenase SsuD/methylene tetrahydromethanopterin reductase-like flavin-dependent oxidoreductase (luciferase family)